MATRRRHDQLVLILNEHSRKNAIQASHEKRHYTTRRRLALSQTLDHIQKQAAELENGQVPEAKISCQSFRNGEEQPLALSAQHRKEVLSRTRFVSLQVRPLGASVP